MREIETLRELSADGRRILATRFLRSFAFGSVAVVLALLLESRGLEAREIGAFLTCALVGDVVVSLAVTTSADRIGRRRLLRWSALLLAATGLLLLGVSAFWWLLLLAFVGVTSPSGGEVGPFLAIEQAALAEVTPPEDRTRVFAWHNLAGSIGLALGSLAGGVTTDLSERAGLLGANTFSPLLVGYALLGGLLWWLFSRLSAAVEPESGSEPGLEPGTPSEPGPQTGPGPKVGVSDSASRSAGRPWVSLGVTESRGTVLRLSALFALDAFGGGFVMQSLLAFWLHERFELGASALGAVFLVLNLLNAGSLLVASRLAARIGLVRTMVFTHLPSNGLLMLVPFAPNAAVAIALLLLRACLSQMDVPTRQALVAHLVPSHERSGAAGIAGVSRSIGASLSPVLSSAFLAAPGLSAWPFLFAGGTKVIYDLALFRGFGHRRDA